MILVRYLSSAIGFSVLATIAVLLALALALDLLDNAPDVIAEDAGGGLARYALLRAPMLALSIAPVALLVGATVAFLRLGARSELTVVRAVGVGVTGMVVRLVPMCLVFGVGLHLLAEYAVPAADYALARDYPQIVETEAPGRSDELWLRTPTEVVRLGAVEQEGAFIEDLTVFRIDADGLLLERVDAASARFGDDGWSLTGVTLEGLDGKPAESVPAMRLETSLMPGTMAQLLNTPSAIRAADARAALQGAAPQLRAATFYEVRSLQVWPALVVPFVMLLLAVPAGLGGSRDARGLRLATLGLILGFGFIGVDGVVVALGERGLIDAVAAVWAAPVLFTLTGFWVVLLAE